AGLDAPQAAGIGAPCQQRPGWDGRLASSQDDLNVLAQRFGRARVDRIETPPPGLAVPALRVPRWSYGHPGSADVQGRHVLLADAEDKVIDAEEGFALAMWREFGSSAWCHVRRLLPSGEGRLLLLLLQGRFRLEGNAVGLNCRHPEDVDRLRVSYEDAQRLR